MVTSRVSTRLPSWWFFIAAVVFGSIFILASVYARTAILSIGLPLAIMVAYIYLVVTGQDASITREQKADSCYYLGFIFTLVAMIAALLNLSFSEENYAERLTAIIPNFGLALVTTIVGLVVRIIWLQLQASTIDDAESLLVDKIKRGAEELGQQSGRINAGLKKVADDIENISLPSDIVVRLFTNAMNKITESADALSDSVDAASERFGQMLKDLDIPDEVVKNLGGVSQAAEDLDKKLVALGNNAEEIQGKIGSLGTIQGSLSEVVAGINRSVGDLSQAFNKYRDQINQLSVMTNQAQGVHGDWAAASAKITTLINQSVAEYVEAMRRLKEPLENVIRQITNEISESLKSNSNLLSGRTKDLEATLKASDEAFSKVHKQLVASADFVRRELKSDE